MSYKRVWLHIVWSTKFREPWLNENLRPKLFKHIRRNASEKGIYVDYLNGYVDHVHCLISLEPKQSFDKIVMLLKGESSHWINEYQLISGYFEWQTDFYVVSISDSDVNKVRDYIRNQDNHHKNNPSIDELDD